MFYKELYSTIEEYLKRCDEVNENELVTIGGAQFLPEVAEYIYKRKLYVVTAHEVYEVLYNEYLKQYYGREVYGEDFEPMYTKHLGPDRLPREGTHLVLSAKEVNNLLGYNFLINA